MKKRELRQCSCCLEMSVVPVRRPSHVFHALMSILTLGLWIAVWMLALLEARLSRGPRCPRCAGRLI